MAPWINVLLKEAQNLQNKYDLRSDAPLFDTQHPLALKAQLMFEENPATALPEISILDLHYACFPNAESVLKQLAKIKIIPARPHHVHSWKLNPTNEIAFDFLEHGVIVLSKSPLQINPILGVHQHTLPYLAHYALSPEVWGPQGKWIRFHERLQQVFAKLDLLEGSALPGLYPLKARAQKLETFGFHGSIQNEQFILTMPWTFPLTGLNQLEKL